MELNESLSPIEQCFPKEVLMAFFQTSSEEVSEIYFYQRFSRDKMDEKLRVGLFDRILYELRAEVRSALIDHRDRVQNSIHTLISGRKEKSIQ
jgi:hypothetical protein